MQADLRIEKRPPECVSSNQSLMFLSDMHSLLSGLSRFHKVCTVLQISLPEIHNQHYISGKTQWWLWMNPGASEEWF